MKNPKHLILSIPTHQIENGEGGFDTVPTIPGAAIYDVSDSWIVVYGEAVNRVHPAIAFVREIGNGDYLLVAEISVLNSVDLPRTGKNVNQYGLKWRHWRFNGSEPDNTEEAKPGARRNVMAQLHKFAGEADDLSTASDVNELGLPGDKKVTKAWPSLDSVISGYGLLEMIEPPGVRN